MPGAPAEVGSTANNYQILARLAVGGMAEIFLARGASAAGVERYCVLKRILRNRAADVHFVRMFLDEARLAAQLNHPNVAQVHDIGKLGDSYFFTMEYVHGETVRAVLQRARSLRRELPVAAVLTMVAGAAAGLHHAHERLGLDGRPLDIVHRDVSPSNLMVSFEGSVKVVDFGVAKAADRMSETRSGTVKGKISYLSPEQCRGAPVDRRTDLFALGIVMWEMLTTERLFRRASDFENMNAIVNEPTPPPSTRRASVPPALDAIALKLLAKDPADRYQTASELIEALEEASVACGAMISTSGLGKLLRELFGQRPEPWLELDPHDAPEGVTVTSQPVPSQIDISLADAVDLELSAIPDLSEAGVRAVSPVDGIPRALGAPASAPVSAQHVTSQMRPMRAGDASGRYAATLPLPAVPVAAPAPASGPIARPLSVPGSGPLGHASQRSPALAEPSQAQALPPPPSVPPPVPPPPSVPPLALPRPHTITGPNAPTIADVHAQLSAPMPNVPGSGRHALPGAAVATIPGPPGSDRPSIPPSSRTSTGALAALAHAAHARPGSATDRPARGWPMFAVIGAAALIGSLTVGIAMRTGDSPAVAPSPISTPDPAAGDPTEAAPRPPPEAAARPAPEPAPVPASPPEPVTAAAPSPAPAAPSPVTAAAPSPTAPPAAAPAAPAAPSPTAPPPVTAAAPDAAPPAAEASKPMTPPSTAKRPRREPRDIKAGSRPKAPAKPAQDDCANPMACQH